jgi:hypothetical protein
MLAHTKPITTRATPPAGARAPIPEGLTRVGRLGIVGRWTKDRPTEELSSEHGTSQEENGYVVLRQSRLFLSGF